MLYLVVISPSLWLILTVPQIFLVVHDLDITKDQSFFLLLLLNVFHCRPIVLWLDWTLVLWSHRKFSASEIWKGFLGKERGGGWWWENSLLLLGPVKQGPFPPELLEVSLGEKPQKSKEACATQGLEVRRLLSTNRQCPRYYTNPHHFAPTSRCSQGVEGALQIGSPPSRIGAQIQMYILS